MRTCLLFVTLGALVAAAQSASTTYSTDLNGNRIAAASSTSADGVTTDLRQSINGKEVPLEQVVEKVLSKNGPTTVTERIVRHYGSGGQVVSTERIVLEETTTPDGGSTAHSTTYRSDISGNMSETERKTVETRKVGASTVTDTAVEKKDLNGSFAVAEKRSATVEPTSDGKRENETVFLRDSNGRLYEAERVATVEKTSGNQTVANTAIYEPGVNGQMSLAKQNVVTTTTGKDGSSTQEIETYGRTSDGHAHQAGAPPSLTEKRVIERQIGAGGVLVETQSVQVPSVNDPGRLDPAQKTSETICRGQCTSKP